MERFLVQCDVNFFGFIVEIKNHGFMTEFKMYKIESEDIDWFNVTDIAEGTIKFDACIDIQYKNAGKFRFGDMDDLMCMNKCFEFIWKKSKDHLGSNMLEEWVEFKESIQVYSGEFKIK